MSTPTGTVDTTAICQHVRQRLAVPLNNRPTRQQLTDELHVRFGLSTAASGTMVTLLRVERAMFDAGNDLLIQGRNVTQAVQALIASGLIDADEAGQAVEFASKLIDSVRQNHRPGSSTLLILARVAAGLVGAFFLLASAGGFISGEPGTATVLLVIALSALAFATRPIWRHLTGPKAATA